MIYSDLCISFAYMEKYKRHSNKKLLLCSLYIYSHSLFITKCKKNMLKKKPSESKDELFTNQCVILKNFQSRL